MKVKLFTLLVILSACTNHFEKKIIDNDWQLTVKDEKLLPISYDILSYIKEYDGGKIKNKKVEILKIADTPVLVFTVKEINESDGYFYSLIGRELSNNVLNKKQINIRLQDDKGNEKLYKFSEMDKIATRGNTELYYSASISNTLLQKFLNNLEKNGFVDENERNIRLKQNPNNSYSVYLVVDKDITEDEKITNIFRKFEKHLSLEVFQGKKVEILLCNQNFEPYS